MLKYKFYILEEGKDRADPTIKLLWQVSCNSVETLS